jgi:hypothetical protein
MNRAIYLALAALLTTSSAAGCTFDAAATCKASGGTYTGGTCSLMGPRQQAAKEQCAASGGVYFVGSNACLLGSGGP